MPLPRCLSLPLLALVVPSLSALGGGTLATPAPAHRALTGSFKQHIAPLLERYCYDCHGSGIKKGGLTLDEFSDEKPLADPGLWLNVLKKTRAGLMPPFEEAQPTPAEIAALGDWIKTQVFRNDPTRPDPGRVTLRRLNRSEYRNTIRDLTGVKYDTELEFPADDTGEGFDNIGEVLNVSPMLLEKYFDAAQHIVAEAVARRGLAAFTPPGLAATLPVDPAARPAYARTLLGDFATRAFRRPVQPATLTRLVDLAASFSTHKGQLDEAGLAQSLVAILASPRFIFREELPAPLNPGEPFPLIDEYALAARLSYFFWSTTPDAELFALAQAGRLRDNLDAQVNRLLASPRSRQFVENFAGQWLHSRDIPSVAINDFFIYLRDQAPPHVYQARLRLSELQAIPEARRTPEQKHQADAASRIITEAFAGPRPKFGDAVRQAMKQETEMQVAYLLTEDRSLLELLDCDYTFLNEALAKHYGIEGVTGNAMRKVTLPPSSPRGGILTQGTFLVTTSNPTRTSPVKRGVFILDNILGAPPSPPPPNIPSLEDAASKEALARMTLRETLALHRAQPLCSSCHNSMDPLGLALENFNALGQWRDHEKQIPIDAGGQLITGEKFSSLPELKRILVTRHAREFYQCVSEKVLLYALGRSLDYYDTTTLDQLVDRLEATKGSFPTLLREVVHCAPFQRMRATPPTQTAALPSAVKASTP